MNAALRARLSHYFFLEGHDGFEPATAQLSSSAAVGTTTTLILWNVQNGLACVLLLVETVGKKQQHACMRTKNHSKQQIKNLY